MNISINVDSTKETLSTQMETCLKCGSETEHDTIQKKTVTQVLFIPIKTKIKQYSQCKACKSKTDLENP